MLKKTAVITFHRALNYGAILQAYALKRTLEKLGCDAAIIDYRCPHIESVYRPFDTRHCKNLSSKGKKCLKSVGLARKRRRFDRFAHDYLNLTRPCKSREDLQKAVQGYDAVITGSDQVFNPDVTGCDRSYFLDFVSNGTSRIAYGASIGYAVFPQEHRDGFKELLERFNAISVREKSACDDIAALSGLSVGAVLDPTLLLSKQEWLDIAQTPKGLPERYVLVYMMEGCRYVIDHARKLARESGAKLVLINPTLKQQVSCKDFVRYTCASPQEFVGAFAKAQAVVTNSFHGAAFSLIFQKDFYAEASNREKSSRIVDLLCSPGLTDRLLPDASCGSIRWEKVDSVLRREREASALWLKNALTLD